MTKIEMDIVVEDVYKIMLSSFKGKYLKIKRLSDTSYDITHNVVGYGGGRPHAQGLLVGPTMLLLQLRALSITRVKRKER